MKSFFEKKYSFLLILILGTVLVIMLFYAFSKRKEGGSMFKNVSGKEVQKKPKERLSNYQKIKRGLSEDPDKKSRLSKKAELERKKNFKTGILHTQEENSSQLTPNERGQPKKANRPTNKKEEKWFSNISNPELVQEEVRYRAVFRESQDIRPEKHIQIVLQDEIPSLNLEAGTILNGLPHFVGGRINIQITSAKIGHKLVSLSHYGLICLDDPSLAVGLYHDEVARMFSEASKKSLTNEFLDLGPDAVKSKIEKGLSLVEITKGITIEKGRQLFVALPPKKTGKNDNG